MPKKKEIKDAPLDNIADALSEVFGASSAIAPRWFLSSGNLALDYILSGKVDGTGGYPSGVVELHGDPATGKSLLLAKAVANAQIQNLPCILADAEGRWDVDFAALQGVDNDKLYKFYPDTVEEYAVKSLEIINKIQGKIIMILDSMAILSTAQEREDVEEGEMKADQGRKAQKIKAAMRVLSSEIAKTGSLFLVSNHMIAQPGAYMPRTTPGGQGVPFQANVRLELGKPTEIKLAGKERPIGVKLHVKCTKNSVIPPFGSCNLELFFATGINCYSGLLEIAKDIGAIEQRAGYYYYENYKEGKGFQTDELENFFTTSDILKSPKWTKPYWLGGEI